MRIKHIITSGCSFSAPTTTWTWPVVLENNLKNTYPYLTFDHRGLGSQGQQLIQKKTVHAIHKAINNGYEPEEIAVIVMWSGLERRSWYIDNEDTVKEIIDYWIEDKFGSFELQFGNIENNADTLIHAKSPGPAKNGTGEICIPYNKSGGWYINSSHFSEKNFFKEYFMFSDMVESVIMSLENMLLLQSVCKSLKITLYEQFYMNFVYDIIQKFKNHGECKHLFDLLDKSTYVDTQSIHEYLISKQTNPVEYFTHINDPHPNANGHLVWVNNVLLPFLDKRNFFK